MPPTDVLGYRNVKKRHAWNTLTYNVIHGTKLKISLTLRYTLHVSDVLCATLFHEAAGLSTSTCLREGAGHEP
jgi:hypothetical protein